MARQSLRLTRYVTFRSCAHNVVGQREERARLPPPEVSLTRDGFGTPGIKPTDSAVNNGRSPRGPSFTDRACCPVTMHVLVAARHSTLRAPRRVIASTPIRCPSVVDCPKPIWLSFPSARGGARTARRSALLKTSHRSERLKMRSVQSVPAGTWSTLWQPNTWIHNRRKTSLRRTCGGAWAGGIRRGHSAVAE